MQNESLANAVCRDDQWLELLYPRVTDQFVLSRQSLHNTHQWVISLALALITVVLTLGGQDTPYPNEYGLVAILVSLPLLFRFFVRSCLETSIQDKWMAIRNAQDMYLYCRDNQKPETDQAARHLLETVELYYFQWKSSRLLREIIWDNLRLAYLWPSILVTGMLVWALTSLCITPLVAAVAVVVGAYMVYEICSFVTYGGFQYARPKTDLPSMQDFTAHNSQT
jgi:hypothetical protein